MARLKTSLSALFLPARTAKSAKPGKHAAAANPAIQLIWDVVSAIPRGQVSTYGAVARAAGLPGRARLTGFALREAPKNAHLPWHRVVGAGGKIVFPKSSVHYREQVKRLLAEKVEVKNGRVARDAISDLELGHA